MGPGEHVGDSAPQQTSEAVPLTVPVAPLLPVHSRICCGGQVIDGAVVSRTVTLVPHCAWWLDPSVTEQLAAVVPSG